MKRHHPWQRSFSDRPQTQPRVGGTPRTPPVLRPAVLKRTVWGMYEVMKGTSSS